MSPTTACRASALVAHGRSEYISFLSVAKKDSNALNAIMCRVGAGQQAEGHIGNPLST